MLNSVMYVTWTMVVIWSAKLLKSRELTVFFSAKLLSISPRIYQAVQSCYKQESPNQKCLFFSYHWLILWEFCKNDWIHEYNFLTRNAYLYNMPQAIKQMFNFLFNIVLYVRKISLLFLDKKIVISVLNKDDKLYWTGNVE